MYTSLGTPGEGHDGKAGRLRALIICSFYPKHLLANHKLYLYKSYSTKSTTLVAGD